MKKRISLVISILVVALLFTACQSSEKTSVDGEDEKGETLAIYTTLFPLKDFAEKIGKEKVDVRALLPAGGDPHTYEPTSNTMVDIAEADAFIYNGAGLEAYAETIADAIGEADVHMLEASAGIKLSAYSEDHSHGQEEDNLEAEHESEEHSHKAGHDHDSEEASHGTEDEEHDGATAHSHAHGDLDPHVWLDPVRSITLAENIKNLLVELAPDQEAFFEDNFAALKRDLEVLDNEFERVIEKQDKSKILVSHAAYGYWEKEYGVEQIAISGLTPSNEPSQKQLEEIIEISNKENMEYILFEQNVTPKVAEVVQNEIGANILRIHNLSVLTEEEINQEEDYFSLMEQNLEVLRQALQ